MGNMMSQPVMAESKPPLATASKRLRTPKYILLPHTRTSLRIAGEVATPETYKQYRRLCLSNLKLEAG